MTKKELLIYLKSFLEDGKTHTIRIFGHGASGKSQFAKELINLLDADSVNLLETDPYIMKSQLRQLLIPKNFPEQKGTANIPSVHELNSLTRDIKALQSGIDILTIEEPWAPSKILSATKPILIVEGMSAGFLENSLFDLNMVLKTDNKIELERRLKRDVIERGGNSDSIISTQESRRQQYNYYYQATEKMADILIEQTSENLTITIN